jgi:acetoin utilization protein AcuB
VHRSPISVHDDDRVSVAMQTMFWEQIRHLPVTHEGAVVGVVSERDILAFRARDGRSASEQPVKAIMSHPAVVVAPEATVEHAAGLMRERRLGCLPVVSGGGLVGVVTRTDILGQWQEGVPHHGVVSDQRVGAVMKRSPVTATDDDELLTAIAHMENTTARHLPVVDGEGRLVGMLSDRDVRGVLGRALRGAGSPEAAAPMRPTRVAEVMSRSPVALTESATVREAAAALAQHRIGALPIVNAAGQVIGIVSYVDILRACVL